MYRYPIFIISILFIVGIIFQDQLELEIFSILIPLIIAFVGSIFHIIFFKKIFTHFWILLFFFILGAFIHSLNRNPNPAISLDKNENLTFIIDKKLNSNEKNRRYEVLILNKKEKLKAIASIPKNFPELDFSHYYNANAYTNIIEKPKYQYQFDYKKYTERKNIFYQIYLPNSPKKVEKPSLNLTERIKQYRLSILQNIDQSTSITKKNRELLKGIILADRTEMDEETISDFTQTGLIHILAISGAHIAIIFMVGLFILEKLLPKKWAIILSFLFIWLFVILIDFGNSVVRASIMLSLFYGYRTLQRTPNPLHIISLSALIILIFNTHEVFDIGFQLSFIAVLGIHWLNRPILSLFPKKKNKIYHYFIQILSLTTSAQLATLPLVLYYFHQFPLSSFISNLIVIPIAEVVIIFSFFITLIFGSNLHIPWIEEVYDFISQFFLSLVHFFSQFDVLLLKNIPMNLGEAFLLSCIIFQLKFVLEKFEIKNTIRLISLILIFIFTKTIFDLISFNKNETLVHHFYKESIFSIKNKDKIQFYINEESDTKKINKYIISPYLIHCRTSDFEIKKIPKNTDKLIYKNKVYPLKNPNSK